jgi:hypothetical protein
VSEIKIGLNSIQISGRATGLIGAEGKIKSNLMIDSGDGVRLQLDAKHFPFLTPNEPVFVIIGLMQVREEQASVLDVPKKTILLPGQ